jgi:hypothetical protein
MGETGFEYIRPVPVAEWIRQIAARFCVELQVVLNTKQDTSGGGTQPGHVSFGSISAVY